MRRTLLGIAAIILGGIVLSALYLGLRHDFGGVPLRIEAAAVVAFLLVISVLSTVALLRDRYRRTLRELGERLTEFRQAPSGGGATQRFQDGTGGGGEWTPLLAGIEGLANAYRQTLAEVVRTQEALERFRSFTNLADAEKGKSHSLVLGNSSFFRSTRLIARLAPNLHWIAATAALQRFLGKQLNELIAHSFLECVHPDDAPALSRPFQRRCAKVRPTTSTSVCCSAAAQCATFRWTC